MKFCKIHRKTPVSESLCNNIGVFLWILWKSKNTFFYRTSMVAASDYNQPFIDLWYNWQYADWSTSFFIYSTTLFKYRFNLRIFKNVSWSYEQYNSKGITILHYNFSRKIILLVRFRTIKGINLLRTSEFPILLSFWMLFISLLSLSIFYFTILSIVSSLSIKIILWSFITLFEKKGFTVFQNSLLSVILFTSGLLYKSSLVFLIKSTQWFRGFL